VMNGGGGGQLLVYIARQGGSGPGGLCYAGIKVIVLSRWLWD
jgi:hypothetical protein